MEQFEFADLSIRKTYTKKDHICHLTSMVSPLPFYSFILCFLMEIWTSIYPQIPQRNIPNYPFSNMRRISA